MFIYTKGPEMLQGSPLHKMTFQCILFFIQTFFNFSQCFLQFETAAACLQFHLQRKAISSKAYLIWTHKPSVKVLLLLQRIRCIYLLRFSQSATQTCLLSMTASVFVPHKCASRSYQPIKVIEDSVICITCRGGRN